MEGTFFDVSTLLHRLTRLYLEGALLKVLFRSAGFYLEGALLEMLFGSAGFYVESTLVYAHKDSAPAQVDIVGMADRIFYSSNLGLRLFQLLH